MIYAIVGVAIVAAAVYAYKKYAASKVTAVVAKVDTAAKAVEADVKKI